MQEAVRDVIVPACIVVSVRMTVVRRCHGQVFLKTTPHIYVRTIRIRVLMEVYVHFLRCRMEMRAFFFVGVSDFGRE